MPSNRLLVLLTAALLLTALPAAAQPPASEATAPLGVRVGYTSWEGVEQVHFGAHLLMGEITENVDFTPSIEIGTGSDLTVVSLNGDLTYRFTEFVAAPWGFHAGASLAMLFLDNELMDTDVDIGLSVVSGVSRVFDNGHEGRLEVRLGVLDAPGFKLTCGYTLF